ncbi:hypothetical protein K501DRAFT_250011 [Backusella circina FSU 941]|nr:hypothetical protein K501DRAFT_250011 [Backusella circina FSU 941]
MLTKTTRESTQPWIKYWFLISSIVVVWDFSYCLLRPYSMEGGTLNFLWRPYNLYGKIDHFYGLPAYEIKDGFTGAQAALNVVETLMNFYYLKLLNDGTVTLGQANLVGFSSALMTTAKTILYWLVEAFSGMAHTGHNSFKDMILLWVIPNGLWIVVPGAITYTLGKDLITRLDNLKRE